MNLLKKLIRDIVSAKGQFIAIILVVFLGSYFFTGLSSGSRLLQDYTDTYYSDHNLADIWMYYSGITADDIMGLGELDGVEDYELRFTYQASASDKKLMVHSFDENSQINTLYIVSGTLPEQPFDIAIDYEFALANSLHLGDEIIYSADGTEAQYKVTAFIENPEYVTKIAEDGNGFPEHEIYGIAYVHYSTITELSELTGITTEYDELLVKVSDGYDYHTVIRNVENYIENTGYLYGYTRDLNPSVSALAGDIEQFESLSLVLPIIFFFVAALMTYIAMRRLIDTQKTQIGIMKALGVKKWKIMVHYISFPIIPSVIGSLSGGICGSLSFPQILLMLFDDTYDLPGIGIRVYMNLVIPAMLLATISGIAASYFSCRRTLKLNAALAMRPPLPQAGRKIFLERNTDLWCSLPGDNKIVLRNILCSKRRAFLSCIGIAGSVALMITGFAMYDSTDELIERTYSEIYKYDAIVDLYYYTSEHGSITMTNPYSIPVPEDADVLLVPIINFEVDDKDHTTFGTIRVLENNSDFFRVLDEGLNELAVPEDGIIISQRLADSHNLKAGDALTVKLIDSYYAGAVMNAQIVGISEQYLTQDIYCSPDLFQKQGLDLNPLTMYLNLNNGMTLDELTDFYSGVAEVSSVTSLADQRLAVETYTESMLAILAIMIIGGMLLSFAVIYNISVINIMERRTTLSTMKVLGYSKKKIVGILEKENYLLSAIGIIIGIPLGFLLMYAVFDASATDEMSFPYVVHTMSVIISCILALLFTFISNLPLRRKIKNVNMVESLKTQD